MLSTLRGRDCYKLVVAGYYVVHLLLHGDWIQALEDVGDDVVCLLLHGGGVQSLENAGDNVVYSCSSTRSMRQSLWIASTLVSKGPGPEFNLEIVARVRLIYLEFFLKNLDILPNTKTTISNDQEPPTPRQTFSG